MLLLGLLGLFGLLALLGLFEMLGLIRLLGLFGLLGLIYYSQPLHFIIIFVVIEHPETRKITRIYNQIINPIIITRIVLITQLTIIMA